MKQSQADYINFRYLLKSNYRKGVHTMRSILADAAQAKMFAENPAAVAVVLSYDKENPDKNAEELYELLTASSVAETASLTYICNTYGVANFGELFADETKMAQLLEDESSMNAIAASESAMKSLAYDSNAMTNIAASETAMAAITNSKTAMKVVANSSIAMNAIAASSTATNMAMASEIALAAITANDTALEIFIGSSVVMEVALSNDDYLAALASSTTSMAKIASSDLWMNLIAASSSAMLVMASHAAALNAICKVSDARTKWMNSSHAHANYSTVYETLHNAPSSLFVKHEDYYDTAFASNVIYTRYSNESGGFSSTSLYEAGGHSGAVPFAGITLANTVAFNEHDRLDSFAEIHYGSSQTKSAILDLDYTNDEVAANLVAVGGLSYYSHVNGATYGGYFFKCKYATYTAV